MSPISINQTIPSNKNINFHTENDQKKHISDVNEVNHVKDNKPEKQTICANNDSSHTTTEKKNNNNDNNSNNSSDNIQETITPNPSPNPSKNKSQDQSTGEWKKGTTLIVGDSMIAGLREAKLSRNRKVKVRFLPGAKTEDLMFHLIPYLNKKPDNIIIHIGTNDGPYNNENTIYVEIKKIKELIKNHRPDSKNILISSPILRLDNKKAANVLKNYINILKREEHNQ